ncbi:hypothetical protein [Paraferrimonas sedimenticola]|uniref:hypothetical protein n=1 Tax=Paraferrimonas sedimenticola TaxID=375674 RepID=UPI001140AE88|nr:hypothetical protein [Paraferrimonas sedimenticola]
MKGSISTDFTYNSNQTGMLTLEGTMDKEGGYSDSRLQYFHVFSTGDKIVPRAAASVDIIDNALFSSASVGGVVALNTGVKGLQIFPRFGGLVGEYKAQTLTTFDVQQSRAYGVSGAFYVMYTLGDDGTYIGAWPEYNYLDGDIETSLLKSTLMIATPLDQAKSRWGQLKLEKTTGSMKTGDQKISVDDTVVWANYKFYF